MKEQLKKLLNINHPIIKNLVKVYKKLKRKPFFIIITPVFDPAVSSLRLLIEDLQKQTFADFKHISLSNGVSERVKHLIHGVWLEDKRFVYYELPEEKTQSGVDILINLGKRREYALKEFDGERYIFMDADLKLLDEDYLKKLHKAHVDTHKDIILTLVKLNKDIILPKFPIGYSHIDMANFTFSYAIAKKYNYPTDYDASVGIGNDYRFFERISNEENTIILNFVSSMKDGYKNYKGVTEILIEEGAKT